MGVGHRCARVGVCACLWFSLLLREVLSLVTATCDAGQTVVCFHPCGCRAFPGACPERTLSLCGPGKPAKPAIQLASKALRLITISATAIGTPGHRTIARCEPALEKRANTWNDIVDQAALSIKTMRSARLMNRVLPEKGRKAGDIESAFSVFLFGRRPAPMG